MTDAEQVAAMIRKSDTWDDALNRRLCDMAGMLEEYDRADGDTFEQVAIKAADKLKVTI